MLKFIIQIFFKVFFALKSINVTQKSYEGEKWNEDGEIDNLYCLTVSHSVCVCQDMSTRVSDSDILRLNPEARREKEK